MKQRMGRVALLFGATGVAALVYLLLFRLLGFGLPCLLHELTGLRCPGCGLTRAAYALSRGSFAEAIGYNPLLILYVGYGGWFVSRATVRYVKGEKDPLLFGPLWLHIAVLAVTILFGIFRNLWGI